VNISLNIGHYQDTIECDIIPLAVCHILLGRPWHYNKDALHEDRTNAYSFTWNEKPYALSLVTTRYVIVDSSKAFARAHELKNTSEMSGERENHRHMSERHKPNTRENSTSVLLATECERRGVQQI
jgi:hypothetical protein